MRHPKSLESTNTSIALQVHHIVVSLILVLILAPSSHAQVTVQYESSFPLENFRGQVDWTIDNQGNVYLVGQDDDEQSFLLLKINTEGEIDWQRTIHTPHYSSIGSILVEADSGGDIIVVANSKDFAPDPGNEPPWIITESSLTIDKYDSGGNSLWGGASSYSQPLTCGCSISDMVVDDAGFIYVTTHGITTGADEILFPCSRAYTISPTGSLSYMDLENTNITSLYARSGSALVFYSEDRTVYCQNPVYPEEEWLNVERTASVLEVEAGSRSQWCGPLSLHSCTIDVCGTYQDGASFCETAPRMIAGGDPSVNVALQLWVGNNSHFQGYWSDYHSYISVLNSEGTEVGTYEFDNEYYGRIILVDHEENIVISDGQTTKLTPTGDVLWSNPVHMSNWDLYAIDNDNFVYMVYSNTLTCMNPDNGETEWSCTIDPFGGTSISRIRIDNRNRIYAFGWDSDVGTTVAVYNTKKKFTILDATANHDPIAEKTVELYSADVFQPGLITGHIGSYSTDADGAIEFTLSDLGELMHEDVGTGLEIGDLAAVSVRVTSGSSLRHPILLPTIYSVWLDPIKFDEYGIADLASIDNQSTQEYVLDHTEYRYNLLVSVEWDADEVYLEGLRSEFRHLSNFLYDVSDGQIRLDTVAIYDNKGIVWDQADVQVYATNQLNPVAGVHGIQHTIMSPAKAIRMPRKWFGTNSGGRDLTYANHPLGNAVVENFRTIGHEFGHYALGFYDEYNFIYPANRCLTEANYGFMDYQYSDGGEHASEMSSAYRYVDPSCRNTEQWYWNNNYSCWTMFEILNEGTVNGHYVPIKRPTDSEPEENQTPNGLDYVPGPNNNLGTPDFNVGALVEFPVPVAPPAEGVQSLHVLVPSSSAGGVNVFLWKRDTDMNVTGLVDQGFTTDAGRIHLLGVNTFYDYVDASGRSWQLGPTATEGAVARSVERTWQVGDLDLSTGESSLGMGASLSPAEDSVELVLYEVNGYFPMICDASIAGGFVAYSIQAPVQALPAEPDVVLIPSHGGVHTSVAPSVAGGYEASITDSLGSSGSIRVVAEDNAAHDFFFTSKYELDLVNHDSMVIKIIGPDGGSEITLDTLNLAIDSVLILSSPYLVPLTGLSEDVAQGGQAHSVAVSPDVALAGVNSISIWYNESDLDVGNGFVGDESDLQIYRWNDQTSQWDIIGGYVDTSFNYVVSAITELGTYAAFTTDIVTDVEDEEHGDILPYRFELSQNYPNPFNPVTTIEYSLPRRSSVRIDIFNLLGQKVRTLLDCEQPAGSYTTTWDGTNTSGQSVSTGIYFYRFQADDHVETKKMLLLK